MINEERRKVQLEALEALKKNDYNGIVLLPTGVGKSWVLIEALKTLISTHGYKNIWYLCNTTVLRDVDFINELKNWGAEDLIPIINRMCYQKAHKLKGEEVDVVIMDEGDFLLSDVYINVLKNNTFKHKILTTAFIDERKQHHIKGLMNIVYSKSLQEVENKQVLNKSQYHFVNFLMTDDETKIYLQYGESIKQLMEKKHQLNNILNQIDESHKDYIRTKKNVTYVNFKLENLTRERKRFLNTLESSVVNCRHLMKDIYKEDKDCKILIFCELTKQADKVSKYSYHGGELNENLVKFRNDDIQALAVCGKVNRGVNISNIKYIIFESCNQSKTQLIQRIGRGKRLLINQLLNVYFLIPCYMENGKIKATKIRDWILNASNDLDLTNVTNYRYKS